MGPSAFGGQYYTLYHTFNYHYAACHQLAKPASRNVDLYYYQNQVAL